MMLMSASSPRLSDTRTCRLYNRTGFGRSDNDSSRIWDENGDGDGNRSRDGNHEDRDRDRDGDGDGDGDRGRGGPKREGPQGARFVVGWSGGGGG